MKPLSRAAIFLAVALLLGLLHAVGLGLPLLLGAAAAILVVAYFMPWLGVRALDRLGLAWRSWVWREEEGHHHAFGGVGLRIDDDGRHTWVAAPDLQRALRTREPEDALAARHSDRWLRDADGLLWLRVDAVVERLATMPGRDDPRVQRLRRYFEREVVFPAVERRRRAG
jgi:hypothetical protein